MIAFLKRPKECGPVVRDGDNTPISFACSGGSTMALLVPLARDVAKAGC